MKTFLNVFQFHKKEMSFLNFIFIFIRLIVIASVVSGKKDMVALEIKLPRFINYIFGIDESLKTFRATLGANKDNSDSSDLALSLIAGNQSDSGGDGIHKRTSPDRNLIKVNIVGANDVASAVQSLIQPYVGMESQSMLDTIREIIRRSSKETKPHVELSPGVEKTEIVTYPPNLLEKKLKYLLQIQQKEEEREKQRNS